VDSPENLKNIIRGILAIHQEYSLPVIFPMHPRTRKMVEQFNISLCGISVIEPTGFFEFLQLESNARLILTDSGGVQEESCILGVPCVTLRNTIERLGTIEVGANRLVGTGCDRILVGVKEMVNARRVWENPYGDGGASVRIVDACRGFHLAQVEKSPQKT
jgi:UDP-N-acetylglucosamine 2-epimerase (non-hydrolysing)